MTTHPRAEVPDHLFTDPAAEARWRARFHAARVSLPDWAWQAPDRTVYASNGSGVWEIYAWDRATDTHRQVTDRPNGTLHATVSPDGEHIWWFDDTDGDEFGSWVREPYGGRPSGSGPEPAVAGTKPGYPAGLEIGDEVVAVGVADDDGTTVYLSIDGAEAEVVYRNENDGGVAAGALPARQRLSICRPRRLWGSPPRSNTSSGTPSRWAGPRRTMSPSLSSSSRIRRPCHHRPLVESRSRRTQWRPCCSSRACWRLTVASSRRISQSGSRPSR